MNFKEQLLEHFKRFESAPFLFIGSGMSRRYLGIENWEGLLVKFSNLIDENFIKLKSQADGDYPRIASLLVDAYSQKWWSSSIRGDKENIYKGELIRKDSPLKVEISDYLSLINLVPHDNALAVEVELLKEAKIDGIITTNWDVFLESLFPKFTKYIGQDGLIASRSHGVAEIYKIHGCSTKPNSLVLTEQDYVEFKRKNPYLSSKLLTLFIEHPIIFLGYSLSDPHIMEILDEIVQCFPIGKFEMIRNNILFVEWSPDLLHPEISETTLFKKLPVKLISLSNFVDLFDALSNLKRRVPAHVLRLIKDELYDLVITNDPKGQLYVKDAADLPEDDSFKEFVVGFGAISKVRKSEELAKKGIIGIERSDIVRDVLFDHGNFDPHTVIFELLPKILKGKVYLPVFKYLNAAKLILDNGDIVTDGMCKSLLGIIKFDAEDFRKSEGERRHAAKLPQMQESINSLYHAMEFPAFLRAAPYMERKYINLDDYLEILRRHIDDDFESAYKSHFVKLVCLYDYYKYRGVDECA